jgi:multiple sugar transport system ATP-binding protein
MSVADRMAILDRGHIRQIGLPSEIYDRPASVYVARQLGSPVMNIFKSSTGASAMESADGVIPISDAAAPAGTVEIGVRPEDVKVWRWSDDVGGRPAQVYEVEPLGGYTVVTVDAGKTRFRALVRGQSTIRPQAPVAISCEASRVHYFDAAGDAIAR